MMYSCWALFLLFVPLVAADEECSVTLPPAIIKGKKFFNSQTGEYIPIKGINYYARPNEGVLVQGNSIDFLTENYRTRWEEDVANFAALGVNTVRVYAVDPSISHDGFMCALAQHNMYAIIGLAADCFECAITNAASPDCYPASLKNRGQFIINEFSKYTNVLAFSAGNEVGLVVPAGKPEMNGPCQKRFLRDMRDYIDKCGNRKIPVGLAAADVDREENALYYNCRSDLDDELENAEFYGINVYQQCDGAATDPQNLPGFEGLLSSFDSYNMTIPVILTEYGCLDSIFPTVNGFEAQRTWLQVDTIFSPRYAAEFAGGLVFEYSTERINTGPFPFDAFHPGNYGVGYFKPATCDNINIPCTYARFPQFDTLAKKYMAVDTSTEPSLTAYDPTVTAIPACPANFAPLSSFSWPSDGIDDLECKIAPSTSNPPVIIGTTTDAPTTSPPGNTETEGPTPTTSLAAGRSQAWASGAIVLLLVACYAL